MSVIVFILVLFVLVLVHEWGHFIVAKKSGIRVDEFGIGFPPKAVTLFKKNGTEYSLNWLPFGGFVKIYGENYEDVEKGTAVSSDSFVAKSRWTQAAVLFAGVFMNFVLAWFLISICFFSGVPASSKIDPTVADPKLTVVSVEKDGAAFVSGIESGDIINSISFKGEEIVLPTPEDLQNIVRKSDGDVVGLEIQRGNEVIEKEINPIAHSGDKYPTIGISMDSIGTKKLPLFQSVYQGLVSTFAFSKSIVVGFVGIFGGGTDLSSISGPIGIASVVGEATRSGLTNLLFMMAIISLNLAVLNLIPFPALDGGRLLFVAIEGITGKSVPKKVFNIVNTTGFFLLIGLMVLVSVRDVIHLF